MWYKQIPSVSSTVFYTYVSPPVYPWLIDTTQVLEETEVETLPEVQIAWCLGGKGFLFFCFYVFFEFNFNDVMYIYIYIRTLQMCICIHTFISIASLDYIFVLCTSCIHWLICLWIDYWFISLLWRYFSLTDLLIDCLCTCLAVLSFHLLVYFSFK